MNTINERILEIRTRQALTQKQFAQNLGITTSYVSRLEQRKSIPSEPLLRLISCIFGESLSWLRTGIQDEHDSICDPKGFDSALLKEVITFRDERNWKQFHTPKDLSISLTLEATELLECFQWSGSDTQVLGKLEAMKEELADVFIYSILMASSLQVDIGTIIHDKLAKNGEKYPVAKSYGSAKKYSELDPDTAAT